MAPEQYDLGNALAAAVADMSKGIPARAGEMLAEMYQHSETLGGLYLDAILDGRKLDDPVLGEVLSPDLMERIKEIPAFRARFDQAHAEGEARGGADSLLRYFRVRVTTWRRRCWAVRVTAEFAAGWPLEPGRVAAARTRHTAWQRADPKQSRPVLTCPR